MDNETPAPMVSDEELDAALRFKLRQVFEAAMADPRKLRSFTFARKIDDNNASFNVFGRTSDIYECIDALSVEAGAQSVEMVGMMGLERTVGGQQLITEATLRISEADDHDRVPHAWVVARLLRVAQRTEGKVKLISLDDDGQPYMGCGDPDCDNCGGDGSAAVKSNKESDVGEAPKKGTERLLH